MKKITKAFVMCAGMGTRLRPLTYDTPKPMLKILNRPLLARTIELLREHGIKDIIINLYLYPSQVKDYFGDGRDFGVNIEYLYEKDLMGTAGGVGRARETLNETFIVMSGDGLLDLDLSDVIKSHKKNNSIATIVLKRYNTKFKYGVVFADEKTNKIEWFREKPELKDIYENRINTGVYVFEPEIFDYIPKGKFYDFGHDVWPQIMKQNLPIYAYEMKSYWCDIGDIDAYRSAQFHALDNATSVSDNKYFFGQNCNISANVYLEENNVLGDNCIIGENVTLKNSIIGNNVCIQRNVELNNCIIMDNIEIKENTKLFGGIMINKK
ncbi:MAG: NDP-sugar synthase [bacterium]|nr:NDP-sugar synthase [bacterium]